MPGGQHSVDTRIQVATLIVSGMAQDEIAQRTGVHKRTFQRWFHDDEEFREAVYELRSEAIEKAKGRLAAHFDEAIDALVKAMRSDVVHASVRAALAFFEVHKMLTEASEFRERIERLEQSAREEGTYR